jgi:hypothetical protein
MIQFKFKISNHQRAGGGFKLKLKNLSMKYILIFIFLFSEFDSFSQKESTLILDTTCIPSNINSLGNKNIYESRNRILNPKENETAEVDTFKLFFQADTISLKEFERIKSKFRSGLNRDTSLVKWTDTSFVVPTIKSEKNCGTVDRKNSQIDYYIGYVESLQLFAMTSIASRQEIGFLKIIDKVSGKIFYIESPSDYPLETIEVSSDTNLLSSYVNDYYSNESFVSLFEISKIGNNYSLKDYLGFFILKSRIKELIWLNANELAIKLNSISDESIETETVCIKVKIL